MTTTNNKFQIGNQVRCVSLGRKDKFLGILTIGETYTVIKFFPAIPHFTIDEIFLRNSAGEEGQFPAALFEGIEA